MRSVLTLSSTIGLTLLIACGASSEDVGAGAGAVQGGARDQAHGYAVGIRSGRSVCSGALIAPNLVLTARHCVAESPAGPVSCKTARFDAVHATQAVSVTTDPSVVKPKRTYRIADVIVPDDDAACGADIALLMLDQNVPGAEAQPATPLVAHSMNDRTRVGREVTVIGYGTTSAKTKDPGVRRVREHVRVSCIPGDLSSGCFGSATEREFTTEGGVCGGDSGSGAYEQASYDRGEPLVLGVLSRGLSLGSECADATYTRTDRHAKMIVDAARRAADMGGYPVPAWAREADGGAKADAGGSRPDAGGAGTVVDAGTTASVVDAGRAGSAVDGGATGSATDGGANGGASPDTDRPTPPSEEEATWTPTSSPSRPSGDPSPSSSSSSDRTEREEEDAPSAGADEPSGCTVSTAPTRPDAPGLGATLAAGLALIGLERRRRRSPSSSR